MNLNRLIAKEEVNNLMVKMRKGSKQGYGHSRLGFNNQDAALCESFSVPGFGKTYWIGLVSDGSTGNPLFSHTEVGSNLMVIYSYVRIQELILSGAAIEDVPNMLYPIITEFIRDMMNKIVPESVIWKYPVGTPDRDKWSSQKRFRNDYFAATLLGFIADGECVVIFSAGDGVILINNELTAIDQNDQPIYPAITINQSEVSFVVDVYKASEVYRLSIATDGLKELMQDSEFVDEMFNREPEFMGLQFLLNTVNKPHLMKDDCTAVTWEVCREEE